MLLINNLHVHSDLNFRGRTQIKISDNFRSLQPVSLRLRAKLKNFAIRPIHQVRDLSAIRRVARIELQKNEKD